MVSFEILLEHVWNAQEQHMNKYVSWMSMFGDTPDSMLAFSVLYGELDEVVEPVVLSLGWSMADFNQEILTMTNNFLPTNEN